MNRREWLIGSGATAVLIACGPGNNTPMDAPVDAAKCSATSDPQVTFLDTCMDIDPICAPNHAHAPHTCAVPGADVVAGVDMMYPVMNPNHTHMITLTAAQFATLQAGGSVTVESTSAVIAGNTHTHALKISCG